jgi:hypothetical protein
VPATTDCATKVASMRALFAHGPVEVTMIAPAP